MTVDRGFLMTVLGVRDLFLEALVTRFLLLLFFIEKYLENPSSDFETIGPVALAAMGTRDIGIQTLVIFIFPRFKREITCQHEIF